ncbi:MAG: Fis family two component sigma-54 specific transcriptional regulator [Parcubacteria group bacterium Gr01-1014_30]|nr:MAG: Fis family two component sigma-54 specific transcriptional regulator [Parcubacteria group bacterium Gr01-1014_30]
MNDMRQGQELVLSQRFEAVNQFIGQSVAAQKARAFALRVAAGSDLTVLVRGETGVGKDHLAELIHELGRCGKPFVRVDCGALTETLSEAELFGHAPGAFTGSVGAKEGLVKVAREGTLFFNEVANMSLGLQAKFLGVLDRKPFRPVGGKETFPVKARIIAATNFKLEEMVRARTFREDLFYRLNVVPFSIAPLRERKEDIPELAAAFLAESRKRILPEAVDLMTGYDWPGNVRQLRDVVQAAALMSNGEEIGVEEVKPRLDQQLRQVAADKRVISEFYDEDRRLLPIREIEKRYLSVLLEAAEGNISTAVAISGWARDTVYRRICQFGLEDFVLSRRRDAYLKRMVKRREV